MSKNTEVINLLTKLTTLATEAPSHIVDVTVTVAGHIKGISISVVTNCSAQMYRDGKQPEPVISSHFELDSKQAKQRLIAAILTVQHLMLKHEEKSKNNAVNEAA